MKVSFWAFLIGASQASVLDSVIGLISPRATGCTEYTIQSGDTCFTIASAANASWAQLVAWNSDLNATCSNLHDLTTLCISNPAGTYSMPTNGNNESASIVTTTAAIPSPTVDGSTASCGQWHYVDSGDSCESLSLAYSITLSDFLFLNPEVWTNCTNLWESYYYCVEAVGYISTYPGYQSTKTTKSLTPAAATAVPYVDPAADIITDEPTIDIANDTRVDCLSYIWLDDITTSNASDCWNLAIAYGITSEELVLWNPSLEEATDSTVTTTAASASSSNAYTYPCTLSASSSYCVKLFASTTTTTGAVTTPTPQAGGVTSDCTVWFLPESYNTCEDICIINHINMTLFYEWNPSVGAECTALAAGTYYCVSVSADGINRYLDWDASPSATSTSTGVSSTTTTPSPVQTGMVSNCNEFYYVQSGDGCWAISNDYGIALDDFYAWNPAIGDDCSGLQADVYVCVGVASSGTATATATTTAASTTSSSNGTPSPIQTGMVSNCNAFYKTQEDDPCWAIAQVYQIDEDDFYAWNPAVGTDCSGLQANVYVCIGVDDVAAATTTVSTSAGTATSTQTGVVTPTPTQSGMVSSCDDFYFVQAGDGCWAISNDHGIALDDFYTWNPAVNDDCSGLQADVYVCIGVSL